MTAHLPADLVLTGGRITTMTATADYPEEVEAIAIRGGSVVGVGTDAEIAGLVGPGTKTVQLGGRRVVPGLIDSHVHIMRAGRTWNDELRWEDTYTLSEALDMIAAKARELPDGQWIRVIGGWDERQFAEGRGPTREELDAASPNNPVYVQMQYINGVFNSLGLKLVGLDTEEGVAASPLPEGFERDADGKLTGRGFGMPLMTFFYRKLPQPSFEEQVASTGAATTEFARLGLTGAIDGGGVNTGPDAYGAIYEAWRRGLLKTRIRLTKHATRKGTEEEDFAGYLRYDHPRFGDDLLQVTGIGEILMYRSHDTIAAPADYSDEAMAEIKTLLLGCAEKGWPVQIHAHQREFFLRLLDVMEEVNQVHPITELRWGFIHAESTYAEDIDRLKKLGCGMLFQSLFRLNGESAVKVWGAERVAHSPEMRVLFDAGIPIGLGSDAMRVASYNPWTSMEWFVTGLTVTGTPTLGPQHRLSRAEVLHGYTAGGAWFSFEEDSRGRLLPGYLADLVVLSADYFEVPESEIHQITSELTLLGGEKVWTSGALEV